MSICVPKHITCNWYTPDFVAGNSPCVLQGKSETRSRLTAGGIQLRSTDFGVKSDNIQIELKIYNGTISFPGFQAPYFTSGTGLAPPCGTLGTVGDFTTELIELIVTFVPTGISTYYYACQQTNTGSPSCTENGTANLQDALNQDVDSIVELPSSDNGFINNQCAISAITSSLLSGGTPIAPVADNYRTGPAFTMLYITTSENADGTATGLGNYGTRYWNGACWKGYDPTTPDCTDPSLSIGSPPTGSPLLCELGPTSDC